MIPRTRTHHDIRSHRSLHRWKGVSLVGFAAAAGLLAIGNQVSAAIVPTVQLATAANYSVLGGQTVTNTGPSVLNLSLGVWPGSAIVGFPPGLVNAPGTTNAGDAVAQQAQSDLTAAYVDAAGRPLNATTVADLSGLTLIGGVYASTAKGPLSLTGTLTLDAQGDPTTVFIFQTDSTLITGSGSSVSLINGAQECNVFWQIGSSATLGTGSVFVGNIMALTSISVQTGVTVHGRALARNGSVTLDNDTFTTPTCDLLTPVTTTTAVGGGGGATTVPGGGAATTAPGGDSGGGTADTMAPTAIPLPRTGNTIGADTVIAVVAISIGAAGIGIARRKRA